MKKIMFVFLITYGLSAGMICSGETPQNNIENIQSEINKTTTRRKLRRLYWYLGDIYWQSQRPQEAVVNFLMAREYADSHKERYPILLRLATIYYQLSNYQQAIDNYQQAEIICPRDREVKYLLAAVYQKIGRPDLAEPLYKKILKINRREWLAYVFLGDTERQRGFYSRAIDYYRQALTVKNKQNRDIYNRLAISYELSGDYSTAKKLWQEYLQKVPDDAAYWNLGKIAWRHGDYNLAADSFSRYLTMKKNDQEGLLWLGLSYLKLGKFNEAENIFQMARENTDDGVTNFCLALLYRSQNRWEKYQECRRKSLAGSSDKIQDWLKLYLEK